MAVTLTVQELDSLLAAASRRWEVLGPVALETPKGRVVDWGPVRSMEELSLGVQPKSSPKRFLFPQPEVLLRFRNRGREGYEVEAAPEARPRLLLGVRPCDARSLCLNLLPYEQDPYYRSNLRSTVVLGVRCREEAPTCFCREVGGDPSHLQGMDGRLEPLPDGRWSLELFNQQAAQALGLEGGGETAGLREAQDQGPRILSLLKGARLDRLYTLSIWEELGRACLNCGICTFLCPTCYCFDIQDERLGSRGRRIRYWDSCMFPLFTQHASGHNPRPTKLHRVRNRFLHKLKYFPDRFGPFSCVGCGRCIRECPVGIDIRRVMEALVEAAERRDA